MIRRQFLEGMVVMTIMGMGGQTPRRADQQYSGQSGVPIGPGSTNIVRANKVIVSGAGEGVFVYNGAPAAGNLASTVTGASGTDQFGNQYLAGITAYGAAEAVQIGDGFITFYNGSLAGGWTAGPTIFNDGSGNLTLTGNTIFIEGSTAVAITGSTTINGSGSTGNGSNGGVTSGPSGTVNAFPAAGPNHTHAELHNHPL